jgi:hypothetical protein
LARISLARISLARISLARIVSATLLVPRIISHFCFPYCAVEPTSAANHLSIAKVP